MLKQRFSNVVAFSSEEIKSITNHWCCTLIGKFFGCGLPLDFIEWEMKIYWNVEGQFQISTLSEGLMLFHYPSEKIKLKILEQGPWSLAG